jgi:small subunit ribosomal protein S17
MSDIQTSSRTLTGRIVSDKMDKTITVLIERRVKHPVYGKILTKSNKIKAHDEDNGARLGDPVTIAECRPVSKHKAWTLVNIDERAVTE